MSEIDQITKLNEHIACLSSDSLKLHQTVATLVKFEGRTLLAPTYMNAQEAKAYAIGASAAFDQMAKMGKFTLESLTCSEALVPKSGAEKC